MEAIKIKLREPNETGIFHNTRHDVATLAKACNILINKVNELVKEVNTLREKTNAKTQAKEVY